MQLRIYTYLIFIILFYVFIGQLIFWYIGLSAFWFTSSDALFYHIFLCLLVCWYVGFSVFLVYFPPETKFPTPQGQYRGCQIFAKILYSIILFKSITISDYISAPESIGANCKSIPFQVCGNNWPLLIPKSFLHTL